LDPQLIIQRHVLTVFGFSTTDIDVQNYRNIFRTYYKSATDYDKDVLSSVLYMRENKCVYYTAPIINVGDNIQEDLKISLFYPNGTDQCRIFDLINQEKYNYTFLCAFSQS
jgi:hypothetical protein